MVETLELEERTESPSPQISGDLPLTREGEGEEDMLGKTKSS